MPDLRYPIGTFHYDGPLTPAGREDALERIATLPRRLTGTVTSFSDVQLDTPYRRGGWTVRQVVHHLPDSHLNGYTRFKPALTEEEPTIRPYDEAAWAELPDSRTSPDVSLRLLAALHERWVLLLRAVGDGGWQKRVFHPEQKRHVTLDELLALYAWHGDHHLAHIASLLERDRP